MVTEVNGIWTVPLSNQHKPYQHVLLKRATNSSAHCVVIVSTVKLIECMERETPDPHVAQKIAPHVLKWKPEHVEKERTRLDPSLGAQEMPRAVLTAYENEGGLLSIFKSNESVVVATFTNGRHRTRYLQFAGATCIPVEVPIGQLELFMKHCACTCCNTPVR